MKMVFGALAAFVVVGCSETEPLETGTKCAEYCEKVDECYRIYLSACMQGLSERLHARLF
jgi:hypothetical protein